MMDKFQKKESSNTKPSPKTKKKRKDIVQPRHRWEDIIKMDTGIKQIGCAGVD
jgi:hypothetical protein